MSFQIFLTFTQTKQRPILKGGHIDCPYLTIMKSQQENNVNMIIDS